MTFQNNVTHHYTHHRGTDNYARYFTEFILPLGIVCMWDSMRERNDNPTAARGQQRVMLISMLESPCSKKKQSSSYGERWKLAQPAVSMLMRKDYQCKLSVGHISRTMKLNLLNVPKIKWQIKHHLILLRVWQQLLCFLSKTIYYCGTCVNTHSVSQSHSSSIKMCPDKVW